MKRNTKTVGLIAVAVTLAIAIAAALWFTGGSNTELAAPAYIEPVEPTGVVHEYHFVAAPTTGVLIEGTETNLWTYNGQNPGPEIRLTQGDTVRIVLENQLPEPTSIHWHGIRVPHAMDGVPGLTQEAVAPGETFVYEFTPPDAGTYWYHSHQRGHEQLARGLYGALIVEDPNEPDYPVDQVWLVDDWRVDDQGALDPDFDSSADIHHSGRWGDLFTVNGSTNTGLEAAPGARIRLRIVNTANARVIRPDFGALAPTVIAMDGLPVADGFPATDIELAPGNRMDVDLIIPADASGEFVVGDSFTGINPIELARIVVVGEPVEAPTFEPPVGHVPDWSAAAADEPDRTIDITLYSEFAEATDEERDAMLAGEGDGIFRWELNGKAWPEPATIRATRGEPQKIRIVNDSGQLHPIHLHGQFFQLVSRNEQSVSEGHFRDTVLMSAFETIEIVVAPYDIGTWLLHCHIQLHAEYGMTMLYEVS